MSERRRPAGAPRRPARAPGRPDEALGLLASARRVPQILWVLVSHLLGRGMRSFVGRLRGREEPGLGPERLRRLLERLGGTFIKLGQVMALQPDLLSGAYREALFDLMDRVPPFGYDEVERVFVEDLGRRPEEVFDRFEREPMGAASIGQVHVAELAGRRLAVKVQRPTAARVFGGDIRLMKVALWLIRVFGLRRLEWLGRPMGDFVAWTGEELDYRIEARYMDQMARNSRDSSTERVPEVERELSSERILVADYLDGVTLLDYLRAREKGDRATLDRVAAGGFVPRRFAENILDNFLSDVFTHGLFHADLHPANLLILPGNVVGYVDFGISGVISDHSRRRVLAMILSLTRADLGALAEHFVSISQVSARGDVTAFRRGLRKLEADWYRGGAGSTERLRSYSMMMLDMLRVCREHRVYPHGETIRYMRSVITADGLISRFAPEVDVDEVLDGFCARLIRSDAVGSALSLERFLESWAAGSRLLRDGAGRLDRFLSSAERRGDKDSGGPARPTPGSRGNRALASASLFFTMALVISSRPMELGWNLFTAGAGLAAAALLALLAALLPTRAGR